MSGSAGIARNGRRNATAMKELGHEAAVPARKALEMLHKGHFTKPPLDLRKTKLMGKEIVHPVHGTMLATSTNPL